MAVFCLMKDQEAVIGLKFRYRDRIGEGHFGVHEDVNQPGEGCDEQHYS